MHFLSQTNDEDTEYSIDRTEVLLSCFSIGTRKMVLEYPKLEEALNRVIDQFKEIQKLFLSLKIAQVSAKAEANRLSINTHFKDVFEKVYTFVDSAKDKISHVNNEIDQYVSELQTKASSHQVIKNALSGLNSE